MQVKFIGTTEFAAGDWIGVELDSTEGKNNGTVNGVRYFDGREGHGLFVKKAQVRLSPCIRNTYDGLNVWPRRVSCEMLFLLQKCSN